MTPQYRDTIEVSSRWNNLLVPKGVITCRTDLNTVSVMCILRDVDYKVSTEVNSILAAGTLQKKHIPT